MPSLFSKNQHHLVLLYNSTRDLDKKCYAAAKSLDDQVIAIDISQAKLNPMDWLEVAELLHLEVQDLISKHHPDFLQIYGDGEVDLDPESALKILSKNPQVMINPIAVWNQETLILESRNIIQQFIK